MRKLLNFLHSRDKKRHERKQYCGQREREREDGRRAVSKITRAFRVKIGVEESKRSIAATRG